ncbi:Hypothetical predicted protein [Marmota monax]|uniref:Uncharacterized protein n=1 Tax=Marmota monax TaxID=9995 RepID=A0A5E4BEC7_MARMO|nr:hypothetical protein GHT09_003884 [Marmota monax]VTJ67271.1 Hypothetical predicted protein [Marmota monax]
MALEIQGYGLLLGLWKGVLGHKERNCLEDPKVVLLRITGKTERASVCTKNLETRMVFGPGLLPRVSTATFSTQAKSV